MDIQFVLDVYAGSMYIVSYISKAQKSISDLLRTACEEARRGNSSIKQQVRDIGNNFLNNVEISAQEAVYIALQLPMRKSSCQVVFINLGAFYAKATPKLRRRLDKVTRQDSQVFIFP